MASEFEFIVIIALPYHFLFSFVQSFDSMFVVQQQNPTTQPFNVNIQDSRIRDGNGGAAFSNAGGVLSLTNLEIFDTTLMAAVSTGSANGVTGMTMVSATTVVSSSIMVRYDSSPKIRAG